MSRNYTGILMSQEQYQRYSPLCENRLTFNTKSEDEWTRERLWFMNGYKDEVLILSHLAMSKRNANAPMLMNEDLSPEVLSGLMFENFRRSCLDLDSVDVRLGFNTIEVSSALVQKWLDRQPTPVARLVQSEKPIENRDFGVYDFMVKDKMKPPLEAGAAYKYAGGQTIAYNAKEVNVVVCPIFAAARDRLLSVLKPNVKIMTGMSVEEFEDIINEEHDAEELLNTTQRIENDFSKFDKSLHEALLRFEMRVYEFLGVSEDILTLWYECHRRSLLRDKTNGVRMQTEFQRKSGDASTFFGNTLVLLGSMCAVYDFAKMRLGLFAGDDSLLFMENHCATYGATAILADLFNLESKLLDNYTNPYFCSRFLVLAEGRIHLVPDVLKVVTKLGRSDMVNCEHVEEYRVSMADNLLPFGNALLHRVLDAALVERYKLTLDSTKVFRILWTLVNDSKLFKTLFWI